MQSPTPEATVTGTDEKRIFIFSYARIACNANAEEEN
jgi:hypothetical protein